MPSGRVMDQRTARLLADALTTALKETPLGTRFARELCLLNGLQYLAPFVGEHGRLFWDLIKHQFSPEREAAPKVRALWGDVRDLLGCDDRFDAARPYLFTTRFNGHTEQDEPIPGFVCVPAGQFSMGSKYFADNQPALVVIDKPYFTSRTLVTVRQYAGFISDGGYDYSGWWDNQGALWRIGSFDHTVKDEHYRKWLEQRSVDLRKKPMNWIEQEKLPSRPICGVSLFEARAYARWLNSQMRKAILGAKLDNSYEIRLLTEIQWERAARAASLTIEDGRTWPWGDYEESADQHANLNQKVGSVCAVGLYPPSPIGLYDMAGNVWEWMGDIYWPKLNGVARVDGDVTVMGEGSFEDSATPSMRGGSWANELREARCSARSRNSPFYWLDPVGFRVVLSLAK